jgi:hemolysin activation/secretion protein
MKNSAWAAINASELPGSTQPSVVSKYLLNQQPARVSHLPSMKGAPEAISPPLNEQAKKIRFVLNKIILTGNHIYTNQQIEMIYKDKLHKTISVADLLNIAVQITNFYRNNGYIISRAVFPPQHVKNGIAKIQIIEGYLDKVNVAGNPHKARRILTTYGEQIAECRPLEIRCMENYLFLANELPGTQVKALLTPAKTLFGASDLTLIAENKPVTGYLSYDNYGTRYIGPQQMTANAGLNSFLLSGDTTQLTFAKTPKGRELTFFDANYTVPVTKKGTTWTAGRTRSETLPLFILTPLKVDGVYYDYYTAFQFPMLRQRDKQLSLKTTFYWVDSLVNQLGTLLYNDHIRALDFGLMYSVADRWSGTNLINADLRQGLPIFGFSSNLNPATAQTSRPGARGVFTKLTLQMNRVQLIKGPWTVFGVLNAQWTFNPLLTSEQFTFGGSQIGRGYDPAEVIGDKGLSGSLELRYDWNIARFLVKTIQFYAFYDAGKIWNDKQPQDIFTELSATSTGVGARLTLNKYIFCNIMWAQPLTKPVAAEQAMEQEVINGQTIFTGNGHVPRVFFSITGTLNQF